MDVPSLQHREREVLKLVFRVSKLSLEEKETSASGFTPEEAAELGLFDFFTGTPTTLKMLARLACHDFGIKIPADCVLPEAVVAASLSDGAAAMTVGGTAIPERKLKITGSPF